MSKPMTALRGTVAAILAGSLGAGLAHAQGAPAAGGAQDAGLGEITVTAQRREQSLQSTPLAVSAFTPDEMERRQITEASDLMRAVPNFNVNNTTGLGTSNAYWLRGSGVGESLPTFDPPVGTYIDEVFQPRVNAAQLELLDVERIEVLRGPQGTLFGRNTTAGAISFVSRKPQPQFEGRAEAEFGRFDEVKGKLTLNDALSDTVYGRISAFYVDSDGSMKSRTNGERFNGSSSWGLRGALRLVPNDAIDWTISVTYADAEELAIGTALRPNTNVVDDGIAGSTLTGDLFTNLTALRPCNPSGDVYAAALAGCAFNEAKNTLVVSNLDWTVGPGTLSFITGWQDVKVRNNADFLDNNPLNPLGAFVGPHYYIAADYGLTSWSQEVKFAGTASDRVTYVAGVYYMNEDNDSQFGDLATAGPILITDRRMNNGTKSAAAYAQADFRLGDALTLTAGVRYTNEKKDVDVLYRNVLANATFTNAALVARGIPVEQTEKRWTPKLGLQYQFTPDVMGYVSATTGFKSGGWHARVAAPENLVAFAPEKVVSYEAGIRADWLQKRLRTNFTAFRAEYEDRQIATSFPGTTAFVTTNAGDTPINGLEVELQALPTDGLNLYLTYGWMDGELTNPSTYATAVGLGPNTIPIQTPKWSVLGGFSWGVPVAALGGTVTLTADASAKADYYSDWANLPNQQVDQPTLVNASLGYRPDSDRWGIALECKNCTDRDWARQMLLQVAYPGDPLIWNVRFDFRFE